MAHRVRWWNSWEEMNALCSRFLEIIDFIEMTCLWVRRTGLSQPALCFSFPAHKLEKKNLVNFVAKYLAFLDAMLCRRQGFVGWKNIANLCIDFSSAWLCSYHAGRAASGITIWSMFWAFSNFLPRSVLFWQPTDNTLGGIVLQHMCLCLWCLQKTCSMPQVCL